MAGAARDLWIQWAVFTALGASIIAGLIKLFSATYISTPLAISILWALYNIIPPCLVRCLLKCCSPGAHLMHEAGTKESCLAWAA